MNHPPSFWRFVAAVITPATDRDTVLGDLHEGFRLAAARGNDRAARRWYRAQVLRSLWPSARRRWSPDDPPPPKGHPMQGFWQDIRFSVRTAVRRPLVTAVAIVSLTVGMALTTIVFSLMDAALLRPLAVDRPGALALITEQRATNVNFTLPYADFRDWQQGQRTFTDLLASGSRNFSIRTDNETTLLDGELVSGSYFTTLGMRPAAGRLLGPDDDTASATPAVVVNQHTWERIAGSGTPFSSRPVTINNTSFVIVGIVPQRFTGIHVGQRTDVWITLSTMGALDPGVNRLLTARGGSWLWLMGRRRPDVTFAAAAADLQRVENVVAANVGRAAPKQIRVTAGQRGTDIVPESTGETLRVLLYASVLVLIVACANVANLLLARSADRRRELVVRTALGATRLRLIRLLVIDAGLVALVASGFGVLAAWPGARFAASLMAIYGTPMSLDVSLDWRAIGVAVAIGLGAAIVASLAPALHVLSSFKGTSAETASRSASAGRTAVRLRQTLLVTQFAVAMALVVAAALLLRTVGNLRSMPAGFDTDRVALLNVNPTVTSYDARQVQHYLTDASVRLANIPGVEAVGFASVPPVAFGGSRRDVSIAGYVPAPDEDMELNYNAVTGDYFAVMGIDIVAGRALTAADAAAPDVAVVNETMAQRFWPNGQAVGSTFTSGQVFRVVGIARDAKYRMLRETPRPSFYLPLTTGRGWFHVRTAGAPGPLLSTLRQAVVATDATVPVSTVRTLRSQTDANINDERVAMTIGLTLAAAALLLAAVGLFGSMTHMVTQRTRELGIRMALGADAARIHALVLGQGVRLAVAGTGIGLLLATWSMRFIESHLFGVSTFDPWSVAGAAGALACVALAASVLPARRAAGVDPIHALRED